jgi:Domain of unknown function (DUF5667)
MNEDTQLQTYKEKWQSVKLSDSARTRMADSLSSYASFHPVREAENNRSIEQVPVRTFLQRFKLTTMPIAILLAVFVTAGTSFAAQGALPGDFLYPVKTEVNENIRSVLAVSADAEAELQADLLEERLREAQTLHANGKLNGDTGVAISDKVSSQVTVTANAADKSEPSVGAKTKTKVKSDLKNFLATNGLDTAIAAKIKATLNATSLSEGAYDITLYQEDMTVRVTTLQTVIKKHQEKLNASVYAEVTAKLDTAATLVVAAKTQTEVDARASLDKAAMLVGEVEATLSTLGQAKVNGSGVITDIDFSIDPMKVDGRDDAADSGSQGNNNEKPKQTEPNNGADLDVYLNGGVDTEVIEVEGEAGLEAVSGLAL